MAVDGFRKLDKVALGEYIKATPCLSTKLGNELDDLEINMVDEGLMNFVYIVKSSTGGSMVIKQALPYIRSVGESVPMSRERSRFEAKALQIFGSLCPSHVPELYHYDPTLSLIAIQYLPPPHILLADGLVAGVEYPLLADHISEFLAVTCFRSSVLCNTTTEHKHAVAEFCDNSEMTRLIQQLSYMAFYKDCQYTSWTSPELDDAVKAVHEDDTIKLEIIRLYTMFCEKSEALIHSDFHAGSIMVTEGSTQVIDPEFAFYGPMGYDIGTFFRNLIVSFFAQDGHATEQNDRQNYKMWLLKTLEETWKFFEIKFIKLWDEQKDDSGEHFNPLIYKNPELKKKLQRQHMADIFQDALGYCASYLIGSVICIGEIVKDFDSITNVSKRAHCEKKLLNYGKMLLMERHKFTSIDEIVTSLRQSVDNILLKSVL